MLSRWQRIAILPALAANALTTRWRARGAAAIVTSIPELVRQTYLLLTGAIPPAPSPAGRVASSVEAPFTSWLRVNTFTAGSEAELRQRLADSESALPTVSVIMPVFNPVMQDLNDAIGSVVAQVYQNWELCIADDASTNADVRSCLSNWQAQDHRIRVTVRAQRGNISLCTNTAVETATGEFLAFLDQDDELTPDALAEVALGLAAHPTADLLYSDDDKISTTGDRYDPQFKADWSPELLLSYMYFGHLMVVRRSLFDEIGGMRAGFEGSQDHDLALRASEQARLVVHIPQVLYHWRAAPTSLANSADSKPYSIEAGRRAVQDALCRRGVAAQVDTPQWAAAAHLGIFEHQFSDLGPEVCIVIPTKDPAGLLKRCLASLAATTYRPYRVLVLDTSGGALGDLPRAPRTIDVVRVNQSRFNFAALANLGVATATTDYVLLLNDDTEIVDPRWLSQMMGYAQFAGVGAVGAKLLFPDGRVQHAGVVHGYHDGLAGHAFKMLERNDPGYLWQASVARNASAATAACLLTQRDVFQSIGGFDEERFSVAYNDVDYCIRLGAQGLRTVICPVEVRHWEGASRGFVDDPGERARYRQQYLHHRDPFHSPHLSLASESHRIEPRRRLRRAPSHCHVAMVGNAFDLTGAPLHQIELLEGLASHHVRTSWVHANLPGVLSERIRAFGVSAVSTGHPLANAQDLPAYETAVAEFADRLVQGGAEVVFANTLEAFYAVDAARRAGLPAIWNIHESEPSHAYFERFGSAIAERARTCLAYPYRVIFTSDATMRVHADLDTHNNFTLIRSGLDNRRVALASPASRANSRRALGAQPSDIVLLLVGTVCARKAQIDLVSALAQMREASVARTRCVFVGDRPGAYSEHLHECIRSLPARRRGRVTVVAETAEVAGYYQAADAFICTSLIECFPRVILEAMAHGLPIVSTDVFGIPEQVIDGVNGLLFTPGDVPALARHIEEFVVNEPRRRQMAARSADALACLPSFEEMLGRYAELIHEANSLR